MNEGQLIMLIEELLHGVVPFLQPVVFPILAVDTEEFIPVLVVMDEDGTVDTVFVEPAEVRAKVMLVKVHGS